MLVDLSGILGDLIQVGSVVGVVVCVILFSVFVSETIRNRKDWSKYE